MRFIIKQAQHTRNEKGITLIEMVISIGIIMVMSLSFQQLMTSFFENYEIQEAIAETQQQRRVTTGLILQEVSNTGLDPTGILFDPANGKTTAERYVGCTKASFGVQRIFEATPLIFHFLSDLNQNTEVDGEVDDDDGGSIDETDPEEQIRYEWIGADGKDLCWESGDDLKKPYTLYRDSGSRLQEVATNIVAFDLDYFDEDGVQLPELALTQAERGRIRRVVLSLTARTASPLNGGFRERKTQTEIWLRNMG